MLNKSNEINSSNNYSATILNTKKINSIFIAKNQLNIRDELMASNINKIKENEIMNIEKDLLLKRADKSNLLYKTYQKGYAIFDILSKFYKCRFNGSKITLDELNAYIDVPFNLKDLNCDNDYTKERLSKFIVEALNNIK